jgi:hypothetical protein
VRSVRLTLMLVVYPLVIAVHDYDICRRTLSQSAQRQPGGVLVLSSENPSSFR